MWGSLLHSPTGSESSSGPLRSVATLLYFFLEKRMGCFFSEREAETFQYFFPRFSDFFLLQDALKKLKGPLANRIKPCNPLRKFDVPLPEKICGQKERERNPLRQVMEHSSLRNQGPIHAPHAPHKHTLHIMRSRGWGGLTRTCPATPPTRSRTCWRSCPQATARWPFAASPERKERWGRPALRVTSPIDCLRHNPPSPPSPPPPEPYAVSEAPAQPRRHPFPPP